jgi:hypothetical protein
MKNLPSTTTTLHTLQRAAACALLATASLAQAQTTGPLSAVPTAWRVENYVPDNVALWFTGSSCASGQLIMPANATKADRDRLYATVMAGKAAGKPVFVYYTASGTNCTIVSFGMAQE